MRRPSRPRRVQVQRAAQQTMEALDAETGVVRITDDYY